MPGITFTKAYATSDGKTFGTIEEAQKYELRAILFDVTSNLEDLGQDRWPSNVVVDRLVDHSAAIIDILSTTPTSRPKARKSHGGTRRKPAAKETANTQVEP